MLHVQSRLWKSCATCERVSEFAVVARCRFHIQAVVAQRSCFSFHFEILAHLKEPIGILIKARVKCTCIPELDFLFFYHDRIVFHNEGLFRWLTPRKLTRKVATSVIAVPQGWGAQAMAPKSLIVSN